MKLWATETLLTDEQKSEVDVTRDGMRLRNDSARAWSVHPPILRYVVFGGMIFWFAAERCIALRIASGETISEVQFNALQETH